MKWRGSKGACQNFPECSRQVYVRYVRRIAHTNLKQAHMLTSFRDNDIFRIFYRLLFGYFCLDLVLSWLGLMEAIVTINRSKLKGYTHRVEKVSFLKIIYTRHHVGPVHRYFIFSVHTA